MHRNRDERTRTQTTQGRPATSNHAPKEDSRTQTTRAVVGVVLLKAPRFSVVAGHDRLRGETREGKEDVSGGRGVRSCRGRRGRKCPGAVFREDAAYIVHPE